MSDRNIDETLKKELLEAFNLPSKGLKRRENTIMTRVSQDDLQVMESLVDLGIFKSISETAAFFIHESIMSKQDYYQKILKLFREIKSKKLEAVATLLEAVKEEKLLAEENAAGRGRAPVTDSTEESSEEEPPAAEILDESPVLDPLEHSEE